MQVVYEVPVLPIACVQAIIQNLSDPSLLIVKVSFTVKALEFSDRDHEDPETAKLLNDCIESL